MQELKKEMQLLPLFSQTFKFWLSEFLFFAF